MNVVGKVIGAALVVGSCALHGMCAPAQPPPQAATANSTPSSRASITFIQAHEIDATDPAQRFPHGSSLVRLNLNEPGTSPTNLTARFFAAADPQVSFDGRRILFAAQTQPNAAWQVWEICAEGLPPKQITHCAGDCLQPHYLPANQVAYTELEGVGTRRASEVQVSRNDGTEAHPITFGPGNFELETVLHSGRLLLSANAPLVPDSAPVSSRNLYVLDPDGSGLMLLRQDDAPRSIRSNATELADGTILFLQRNTTHSPRAQRETIRPRTLHATRLSPTRSSHASSLQPVLLAPHPVADAYRSILHPDRTTGRIVCLDAYASRDFLTGRISVPITRVRVVTKTPAGETSLGEAPVESDGSFYATLPSDLPVRFMLLGAHGEILKQQRSWIWVRPGEDRGCFGCHESQSLSPQNRSPLTLQRLDTPTSLLGETCDPPSPQKAAQP